MVFLWKSKDLLLWVVKRLWQILWFPKENHEKSWNFRKLSFSWKTRAATGLNSQDKHPTSLPGHSGTGFFCGSHASKFSLTYKAPPLDFRSLNTVTGARDSCAWRYPFSLPVNGKIFFYPPAIKPVISHTYFSAFLVSGPHFWHILDEKDRIKSVFRSPFSGG